MAKAIIILLVVGAIFYLLYINGYLIVNRKRALMFVGSLRGTNSCKATFTSCTGYVKRVVKFKESRMYCFALHTELSAGEMAVELLDAGKQKVMELSDDKQTDSVDINSKTRYYLIFRFKSATGSCEFEWE